eukprot:537917-Alexandrium_andersonii.AAC.1
MVGFRGPLTGQRKMGNVVANSTQVSHTLGPACAAQKQQYFHRLGETCRAVSPMRRATASAVLKARR